MPCPSPRRVIQSNEKGTACRAPTLVSRTSNREQKDNLMPIYRFGTRYSRWDGTQQISALDADDLMKAMSDQLMRDGDLLNALRRLFWEGIDRPDGDRMPGLRELMNRLRQRRQEQLNRYDLGSILDDIREKLQDVLDTERQGIERRLDEGRERLNEQGGQAPQDGQERRVRGRRAGGATRPAGAATAGAGWSIRSRGRVWPVAV